MTIKERNKLVLKHYYLPLYVIKKHFCRDISLINTIGFDDAVQIGFIALIESANKWRSDGGAKFSNYAYRHIVNTILDQRGNGTIRIPPSSFRKIRKSERIKHQVNINKYMSSLDMFCENQQPYKEEETDLIDQFNYGFQFLDEQQKAVMERRREGLTFSEIGKQLSYTKQRIHQIFKDSREIMKKVNYAA